MNNSSVLGHEPGMGAGAPGQVLDGRAWLGRRRPIP